MTTNSKVSLVRVKGSVQGAVREAMERIEWRSWLEKGKPTSLKVNLGWELFIPGSITSPWVLEGVILTIRDWVGPISLVESDQVLERIEVAYRKSGMPEICKRYGVTWVNMSDSESTVVDVPGGVVFRRLELPTILLETQVVTLPVMKTHAKTTITGAIKNQWGCISKLRHNYHLVLSDALADINSVIKPRLAVMDATVALEGNGPKSGIPKIVDHVLASADIVSIDAVQASIMGFDPAKIEHVMASADRKVGRGSLLDIEILTDPGSSPLKLKFIPATHNLVSRIEELLRRSRWKWLFFDTPVFSLMLFGAKFWYIVWDKYVSGNKRWQAVLDHPFYGPLWSSLRKGRGA